MCAELCPTHWDPWTRARKAPLSMRFPSKNTRVGYHFLLQEIFSTQRPNPCLLLLLHWQVDSLPAESQGKTKITGVGSQSLLQQIILTQESNWGLLHFRQIFYQLNYQGNPRARQFIFRNFIISFQKWSEACCYLALTHVGCQAHFLFVFVF